MSEYIGFVAAAMHDYAIHEWKKFDKHFDHATALQAKKTAAQLLFKTFCKQEIMERADREVEQVSIAQPTSPMPKLETSAQGARCGQLAQERKRQL